MRKITALVLVVTTIFLMVAPVFAAVPETVTPQYSHTDVVDASLFIDEAQGIATCEGELSASSYLPVKILVIFEVFQYGAWKTLATWRATGNLAVYISETYEVDRGYPYRVYVYGYVYDNSGNIVESVYDTCAVHYV